MGEAPYLRIAAEIRDRIDGGDLKPGQLAPSARQITREWGVAIATASKVLAELGRAGLVHAVPGVGTVVTTPAAPTTPRRIPERGRVRPDGQAEELSLDRIVHTAIELADAEGLDAASMRRVAASLGAATMSLYRHVPHKEDLLLLMADAALGTQPPRISPGDDWRTNAEAAARGFWLVCRRHHWLAHVISLTRPQPLPNGMVYTDALIGTFVRLGFDQPSALHAAVTIFAYVRGVALSLDAQARDLQDTGITDEQWMATHDADFTELTQRRYPHIAALSDEPFAMDLDSLFEFGLNRLLDGYAAFINRRGPSFSETGPGG